MTKATDVTATPEFTRADFVRRAGRGYTVVRNIFVQRSVRGKWKGSSLGRLVRRRQPRALRAYLLLLLTWSWVEKRDEPLEAGVWARALSPASPAPRWPAAAMTPVWSELESVGLITKERQGRRLWVEPRREDGRGEYTRPRPDQTATVTEKYFILPDAFWLAGWHETLTFPGIAVLLMVLAETTGRDDIRIPYDRVQEWYGIAPRTLQNGLDELRRGGLLSERKEWVAEALSAIGRTQHTYYSLLSPFSRAERQELQAVSIAATKARVGKKGGPRNTRKTRPTTP